MTDWPDETNARLSEIAASAPPGLTDAQVSWLIVVLALATVLVWLFVIE